MQRLRPASGSARHAARIAGEGQRRSAAARGLVGGADGGAGGRGNPDNTFALVNPGAIYARTGRPKPARELFAAVLEKDPGNVRTLRLLDAGP